jgi:hypothetical protein
VDHSKKKGINYKFLSENSFLHMINWSLIIFSIRTFLISTFLISTFSINAFSQEIKSTNEVKSYLPNSKEVGSGFYSFMGFKVYQAHYFVEDDVGMGGFALSLDYLRAISKEDLTKATIKQMLRIGASEEQANTWKKFFLMWIKDNVSQLFMCLRQELFLFMMEK